MGRGVYRNYYKDIWRKSRGRMKVGEGGGFGWCGVEGWGENADNCNRITIKIFLKEKEITNFEMKFLM